jgi:hypothetical protein
MVRSVCAGALLGFGVALAVGPGWPGPGAALEIRGVTHFVRAPWRVDLVSYFTNVWEGNPEYYFTLELAAEAGASLGSLTIQQVRGVDRAFGFNVAASRAFVGRPRREGRALPVQASFDENERRFTLVFPEPVAPGTTVTVVLRPWRNPAQADTYLFQVAAYPAGPDPVASPVGFGTLRIYPPTWGF